MMTRSSLKQDLIDVDELDFLLMETEPASFLIPRSQRALDWLNAHVDPDAMWFGGALVVEAKFLPALVDGIALDGLILHSI